MREYPKELHKDSIKWLKVFGYCLNSDYEDYKKIKDILKDHFEFHYYMWVDLDIKREAEKLVPIGKRYWRRRFVAMKRKLIKEKYGIIK